MTNGLTPEATAELRRKLEDRYGTAKRRGLASYQYEIALALLDEAEVASAKDETLSRYCDHCGQTNYDTKETTP
jgi:hypothetical protein